jgi:hypothetical protein
VAAIGTPQYIAPEEAGVEAERRELEWLLTSGVLGRSGNLARVLKYICEEHFAGRTQIKEYTIATEALGRRPDFDPNSDTIVRVTVHSLRKRLLEVYQSEGAGRPMRLVVPSGHYDPCFVPAPPPIPRSLTPEQEAAAEHDGNSALTSPLPAIPGPPPTPVRRVQFWSMGIIALALVIGVWGWHHRQASRLRPADSLSSAASTSAPAPQATIRALMGTGRKPYVDHSGNTWATGNYCQGGSSVTASPQRIAGTEDDQLYFGGVRGITHCVFPVPQGLYELHFLFAETSDLPMATRVATLSINAGPLMGVDVVDEAGGDGIATSKVLTGVAPEGDGSIHVDFVSDVSLLNAVEILPSPSARLLPVRIVAGSSPYIDDAKQFWTSDRYFSGGRHGIAAKPANLGIYESDRVGRFRYTIPAVPLAHYRLRLYFREPWFGTENGGYGGPGSRIFDVSCNGVLLLKNFDILAEGDSKPVVKTFDHLQASADGKVEIYFMPVVNYPVVSALELVPED